MSRSAGNDPEGVTADLDLLFGQLESLRAVTGDGSADEGVVYDFNIRWGAALSGRLPRLRYYRERGHLTDGSAARYAEFGRQLRRSEPLLKNLRALYPAVPILAVPDYVGVDIERSTDIEGADRK